MLGRGLLGSELAEEEPTIRSNKETNKFQNNKQISGKGWDQESGKQTKVQPGPKRLIELATNKQSRKCLSSVQGTEQKQTEETAICKQTRRKKQTNISSLSPSE